MTRTTLALIAILTLASATAAGAAEHRFGFGGHYWRTLEDVADEDFDIDEDGIAPYLTYQYAPRGWFSLELDLEYFEAGFGGATSEAFSPLAFVLVGHGLYGGVGVGVTVSDDFDNNLSDPFYAARVGFVLEPLPALYVDLNVNYRAKTFDSLDQADSDTVTLGAAVRFGFGDR